MEKLAVKYKGWGVEIVESSDSFDYTVTDPDGAKVDEGQVVLSDGIQDAMSDILEGIEELSPIADDFEAYVVK